MQERLYGAGLGAGAGENDSVRGMTAIQAEQLSGDRLVVPLLLLPYSVVIGMLAPAAAAVMIGVEALSAGALRSKPGQLPAVIGCDFEETRPAPVEHDGEKAPELLFDRCELAHQRRDVHRQTRAMHHGQRNHLEQIDSLTGEDGQTLRMRKIAGCSEELLHPVQVPRYLIRNLADRAPAWAAPGAPISFDS